MDGGIVYIHCDSPKRFSTCKKILNMFENRSYTGGISQS